MLLEETGCTNMKELTKLSEEELIGDSGNVIYIDAKDKIVVAIASSFKPSVHDRITFIQHNILPYIDAR